MINKTLKESFDSQEYNIEIEKNVSIRLFGNYKNHVGGPVDFNNTFKIGDEAEYHSYNLSYTGKIISIGEKTVTIQAYSGTLNQKNHRLSLWEFAWRNWHFDAEKIAQDNFVTMQYI
jgi:hypothetical protein